MKAVSKMKYYTLVVSRDKKVIGKYPQVKSDTKPLEWQLPPLKSMITHDQFLNFESYFDVLLDEDAELTGIIERASVSWGIIINEKFKNIVEKFNIPPHRFYPINVIYRGTSYKYYWFHFFVDMFQYIDLEESSFEIFNTSDFKLVEELPITSEPFIRNKQRSLTFEKNIRIKKLLIKRTFPEYDIWMNNIFGFTNLISKKVMEALIFDGIKGIECHEQENIHAY